MKTTTNKTLKQFLPVIIIVALFIGSAFVAQKYSFFFIDLVSEHRILGAIFYIIAIITAIVVAPLTSVPLIPIAVSVWGVFVATLLSIIGWTIGSMVAFLVARRYGLPIVEKFASLEKIKNVLKDIPDNNLFWYLVYLRIIIPVDILSYALGLFTDIKWKMYFISTVIGVIPATFLLAYLGTVPVQFQVAGFLVGIIVFYIIFKLRRRVSSKKR